MTTLDKKQNGNGIVNIMFASSLIGLMLAGWVIYLDKPLSVTFDGSISSSEAYCQLEAGDHPCYFHDGVWRRDYSASRITDITVTVHSSDGQLKSVTHIPDKV